MGVLKKSRDRIRKSEYNENFEKDLYFVLCSPPKIGILCYLGRLGPLYDVELQKKTGMTQGNFNFYLKDIREFGWVEKDANGKLNLTAYGAKLANRVSDALKASAKVKIPGGDNYKPPKVATVTNI